MIGLLLMALIIFTTYLALILYLFGWIPSISDSYYEFEKTYGSKYGWVFTIVLWAFAIPIMIVGLDLSEGSPFQFLIFLATAGICFTAAAPQFKKKLEKDVHYTGAIVGIIFGILSIGIVFGMWKLMGAILGGLVLILMLSPRNLLYWIEVYSFYSIIFSFFYIKLFGS